MENTESSIDNLYTIKNRALIEELIAFNPEYGNYDRIHALKMVMLYREGKIVQYGGDIEGRQSKVQSTFSSSSFFTENYDDIFNISKEYWRIIFVYQKSLVLLQIDFIIIEYYV